MIDTTNLLAAKTLVVGLGESGLAMAKFLAAQTGFAGLTVLDSRAQPPGLEALGQVLASVTFVQAELDSPQALALVDEHDTLAWSPGLSNQLGSSAALYSHAVQLEKPVLGELDYFALALQERRATHAYQPKLLCITGTNGKTTTTMLTTHLCKAAGLDAVAAGNVSPSMLDVWMQRLETGLMPQVWVLELSSFQLASAKPFESDAAVLLNLSQDHLDWHADMNDYVTAKHQLFISTKLAVYNRQDLQTLPTARLEEIERLSKVKTRPGHEPPILPRVASFGTDEPALDLGHTQSLGLVRGGGIDWLADCVEVEDETRKKGQAAETLTKRLTPSQALRIQGKHNHLNALAALALVRGIGLKFGLVLHALTRYAGEPHRCELVGLVNDVQFIDDSKGTNVGATVAALQGLAYAENSSRRRLILIAGGDGKGQDFAPLASAAATLTKAVICIGRDGPTISTAISAAVKALGQDPAPDIMAAASLQEAVEMAAKQGTTGDIALLSPACASFDMFRNYLHRSEVFIEAVKKLQEPSEVNAGEVSSGEVSHG